MSLGARVDAIFSPDGPLAQTLVAFEPREGQRRMAAAVADTLEDGGVLLVEAGTGTGKTLGYLAPASLWAEKNGPGLWISTYTRNLQRQIVQEMSKLKRDPRSRELKIVLRRLYPACNAEVSQNRQRCGVRSRAA
jgi:Rad3-related DNA helicase